MRAVIPQVNAPSLSPGKTERGPPGGERRGPFLLLPLFCTKTCSPLLSYHSPPHSLHPSQLGSRSRLFLSPSEHNPGSEPLHLWLVLSGTCFRWVSTSRNNALPSVLCSVCPWQKDFPQLSFKKSQPHLRRDCRAGFFTRSVLCFHLSFHLHLCLTCSFWFISSISVSP